MCCSLSSGIWSFDYDDQWKEFCRYVFLNDPPTTRWYTGENALSQHDALPLFGKGLTIQKSSKLTGFEINDQNGIFHYVDATLHDNIVTLTTDSISLGDKTTIRYAWQSNPTNSNLYNTTSHAMGCVDGATGYPASAFEVTI